MLIGEWILIHPVTHLPVECNGDSSILSSLLVASGHTAAPYNENWQPYCYLLSMFAASIVTPLPRYQESLGLYLERLVSWGKLNKVFYSFVLFHERQTNLEEEDIYEYGIPLEEIK